MLDADVIISPDYLARVRRLARLVGKNSEEMLKSAGAQMAARLSFSTQPYGWTKGTGGGKAGLAGGEKGVKIGVSRVAVGVDGRFYRIVERKRREGTEPGGWVTIPRKGRQPVRVMWPNMSTSPSYLQRTHMSSRNHRGRAQGPGRQNARFTPTKNFDRRLVVPKEMLRSYRAKRLRQVGLAKAGWAAAAVQLSGSTRGIPKWVSRHLSRGRHLGTGRILRRGRGGVGVELTNHLPHARANLSRKAQQSSMKAAWRQLERRYEREIAKATRR